MCLETFACEGVAPHVVCVVLTSMVECGAIAGGGYRLAAGHYCFEERFAALAALQAAGYVDRLDDDESVWTLTLLALQELRVQDRWVMCGVRWRQVGAVRYAYGQCGMLG